MNTMEEQVAIVDHYAKGGKVAYRFVSHSGVGPWHKPASLKDSPFKCFNFYDCEYKIVTEPRIAYIIFSSDGRICSSLWSEQNCKEFIKLNPDCTYAKFVEELT